MSHARIKNAMTRAGLLEIFDKYNEIRVQSPLGDPSEALGYMRAKDSDSIIVMCAVLGATPVGSIGAPIDVDTIDREIRAAAHDVVQPAQTPPPPARGTMMWMTDAAGREMLCAVGLWQHDDASSDSD